MSIKKITLDKKYIAYKSLLFSAAFAFVYCNDSNGSTSLLREHAYSTDELSTVTESGGAVVLEKVKEHYRGAKQTQTAAKKQQQQQKKQQQQPAKRYHCHQCNRKSYTLSANLRRHIRSECGVTPQYPCPQCGHLFHHKFRIKNHLKICKGFRR